MEFKLDYNESTPTIDAYKKLIVEMKKMSKSFFDIDKVFENDFDSNIMTKYEEIKGKKLTKCLKK